MATKHTSITIFEPLFKEGMRRMEEKHCASFSEYITDLVRKDVLENPAPPKEESKASAAKKKPQ